MISNESDEESKGEAPPESTEFAPSSRLERGVWNHPLVDASSRSPESSSSYARSLVESAAKSILVSPTPTVSDDENSTGDSKRKNSPPPTLKSLEKKTIPAFPDEQDRKRFIGCLAAILASSYEYDFNLDNLDDDESDVPGSFAYLDVDEAADKQAVEQSFSTHSSFDFSFDESQHQPEAESQTETESKGSWTDLNLAQEKVPVSNAGAQPNKQNLRRRRKDTELMQRARNRHRRRRYELLSNLLLSASDMLLVDKSQAKAFLPMLGRLLVPPTKSPDEVQNPRNIWLRRTPTKQRMQKTPSSSVVSDNASSHGTSFRDESNTDLNAADAALSSSSISASNDTSFLPSPITLKAEGFGPRRSRDFDEEEKYFILRDLDDAEMLRPFLESLSPGAGFRCLALLLLQYLLWSESGYDARVRHIFKKVGVIVLVHEMERETFTYGPDGESREVLSNSALVDLATRKFEALEHGIATKLIRLSEIQRRQQNKRGNTAGKKPRVGQGHQLKRGISREQLVRGLKIGSAGLLAGTLFAVTGGLAAPGIAAGVAAIAGSAAAATAAVVTLTSTAAVTAIFGVGGGSLAAYKMQRRTQGLTEFVIQKETVPDQTLQAKGGKVKVEAELFSTICLSGWLRDNCDFQRPWGVTPTNPRISDRTELLERFYSVHKPDHVSKCSRILANWKGEEKELWKLLKLKYGRDPDHLFPLEDGPRRRAALTHEQDEVLDQLFVELGHASSFETTDEQAGEETGAHEKMRSGWGFRHHRNETNSPTPDEAKPKTKVPREHNPMSMMSSLRGPSTSFRNSGVSDGVSSVSSGFESVASSVVKTAGPADEPKEKEKGAPKHLVTVWDYQSTYGGELYTVRWESHLLQELCDSVTDMAVDVLEKATTHILRQTALATLLSAVALPVALVSAANLIDSTWTLACERSDEAGKELAKSLLYSRAGHRPVTLVGFSMGARAIYACLKELARYQEKWEDAMESRARLSSKAPNDSTKTNNGENGVASNTREAKFDEFHRMREPASIIEDVILMGTPNHLNLATWVACRQVVAGRLVNCYSRKDLVLSLMFQFKRLSGGLKKVCGACPIPVPGIENIDVSDLVAGGHLDYCYATGDILKRVRHGQPLRSQDPVVETTAE